MVIAKVERRPANLDLDDYTYLPAADVKTTSAADYTALVLGSAARRRPLRQPGNFYLKHSIKIMGEWSRKVVQKSRP